MFTTVNMQRHRNLVREQPLQPDCGFGSPPWRLGPCLDLWLWPARRALPPRQTQTPQPCCHRKTHAASLRQTDHPQRGSKAPGSHRGPLEFLSSSLTTNPH